ncbi:hypothetical protein BDC45DRAFT_540535 [Circinella umbellata]|nr:hypothetical protein BDC45DRAFT_540535 [Circinella umbellata]
MASLDFLSSDIVFPSDSNEPKLSVNASSKLPDPVDWSLHDYYSTALEKTFVPIHSLTDLHKLDPVSQKETFYDMPSFTLYNSDDDPKQQLNQDKMLLLLSIRKAVAAALPLEHQNNKQQALLATVAKQQQQQHAVLPPHPPALEDPKEIRAALRGALELTQNDMQHNGFAHSPRNNNEWKWEDEILHDSLDLPVARTPYYNNNSEDTDEVYLIDDDENEYTDSESLPYYSSQYDEYEDNASSISYSMFSSPPLPPINQFNEMDSTTSTTNTTLVSSSRSSSVTATSSSRWSTVMNKIKSITTKPFRISTDKQSNNSNCNTKSTNQHKGGLGRFLLNRRQH